ncbi:MAG: hypothetical protein EA343_17045 [Nodularia sp. (in: Bacteria)]|nr:MAG: hypothetical protein EA343_17045 [Nodularia sp. (in: cyanobacteria)]
MQLNESSPDDHANEPRHPVEAMRYVWLFHSNSKNPSLFGKTNEQGGIAIAQLILASSLLSLRKSREGILSHISDSVLEQYGLTPKISEDNTTAFQHN